MGHPPISLNLTPSVIDLHKEVPVTLYLPLDSPHDTLNK